MTWSIIAHDADTGSFAVAVATKAFAVGAAVPHLRHAVGAVATQSITNRYLGPAVLDMMARGLSPEAAIAGATAADAGRELRQVHAIDRHGHAAAWTGENCVMWCGHVAGPAVSVAGNMLAGEAAGGDRRGRQSAAMVLTSTEDFPDLDLRVDDYAEPLIELQRLLAV